MSEKIHCDACQDSFENKDGSRCQHCCDHSDHDHFICIDCGFEGEPSDYYDEDYGRDK